MEVSEKVGEKGGLKVREKVDQRIYIERAYL